MGKITSITLTVCVVTLLSATTPALPAQIDLANLDWSVQYMIDTSQDDFGQPQSPSPRDNRGLAVSPDGQYLYAGYNNSYNVGEVRKINIAQRDYIDASVAQVTGVRGKAIATDDVGRVYLAEGSSIKIYDADLTTELWSISGLTKTEGVTVTRELGQLALYSTDRTNATLTRWTISEGAGDTVTAATQQGLDGDGQIQVTGASDLRGVEVGQGGRIWMADKGGDKLFRVAADGSNLTSVSVADAMDIGFDDGRALVTQYTTRTISVLDLETMALLDTLTVPWTQLELDPDGQSSYGATSGIVVLPGVGFYVANEAGQTADEMSTYGRDDAHSGWVGQKWYTDTMWDDNDPILTAVPEPTALTLLTVAVLAAVRRRRRI